MKSQIEILIVLPIILCVQATLLVIGAELLDVNFSEEVTFRGLFFLFLCVLCDNANNSNRSVFGD